MGKHKCVFPMADEFEPELVWVKGLEWHDIAGRESKPSKWNEYFRFLFGFVYGQVSRDYIRVYVTTKRVGLFFPFRSRYEGVYR